MQILFSQKQSIQYFVIVLTDQINQSGNSEYIYQYANASDNTSHTSELLISTPLSENAVNLILSWFNKSQVLPQQLQLDTVQYVSDLTLWIKQTDISIHLQELNLSELKSAWKILKLNQESHLYQICESIGQMLINAMTVLTHNQNLESC